MGVGNGPVCQSARNRRRHRHPAAQAARLRDRGRIDRPLHTVLGAVAGRVATLPVVIVPWNEPLDHTWREAVRDAIVADAKWCICCNGPWLRLVDAQHLGSCSPRIRPDARAARRDRVHGVLERNALRSHGTASAVPRRRRPGVGAPRCRGLQGARKWRPRCSRAAPGCTAGAALRCPPRLLFDQSLTVLYRVLFLLFAEARSLVPIWHPIYRDQYTIGAIVATLLAGRRYRGIWDAILAISRLAHAGCRAGELKVTAFNGRLFAPAHSTAFDQRRIADEIMSGAALAVGASRRRTGGRHPISYRDLDVEQLGAVYERVLEYEPSAAGPIVPDPRTRHTTVERNVLHATHCHGRRRASNARAPGPQSNDAADSAAAGARSRDGKRRLSRRHLPLPSLRRGAEPHSGRAVASRRSRHLTEPICAARSRSGVCSASTSIQWLCSSPGCHFGSQRSHQTSHSPFSTIAWSPGIVSSEPVSTTCGGSRHAATGDIGARVVTAVYGFESDAHIGARRMHAPAAGPSARRLAGGRRGKGRDTCDPPCA